MLKFGRDRHLWRQWLFEAKRRYRLSVLNYIVTSNHIHLMVACDDKQTIPSAMQLLSGRVAQSYNRRKQRRGAFWEDRYHAVPIVHQEHFLECLVYIDLNMVRAGVVRHPRDWQWSGYHDIQAPRRRYVIVDQERLTALAGASSFSHFQRDHYCWVNDKLELGQLDRDERWTDDEAKRVFA